MRLSNWQGYLVYWKHFLLVFFLSLSKCTYVWKHGWKLLSSKKELWTQSAWQWTPYCVYLKIDLSNFLYYKYFEISLPQTFYLCIKPQSSWHSNVLHIYQNQIDFSWGILYTLCTPKVLNGRICVLTYAFSTCFKEGKLHGSPGKTCCPAGQAWVCNLHNPLKTVPIALQQGKKPADTGETEVYAVPCFI